MADQKLHPQLSGRPVASLLNKVLYTTLRSITQLLYIDICLSLTKMQSLRSVAEENGVSESIVYSILDLISFDTISKLPQTIAIDEFKGDSGIWDSDRQHWIKVLKRTCYGLHNFESFRKRILLTCGPTQFVTNPAVLFQRNRTKKVGLLRKSLYSRFSQQL